MSNVTELFRVDEITGERIPNKKISPSWIVLDAGGRGLAEFDSEAEAVRYWMTTPAAWSYTRFG